MTFSVIGVEGSPAIFALMHGVNIAQPSASVVGVIAAEMRWPP